MRHYLIKHLAIVAVLVPTHTVVRGVIISALAAELMARVKVLFMKSHRREIWFVKIVFKLWWRHIFLMSIIFVFLILQFQCMLLHLKLLNLLHCVSYKCLMLRLIAENLH